MFQASQACKVVDITRKHLAQMQERKIYKPAVEAVGQGTRNEYTEDGLGAILLCEILAKHGFAYREASRIAFAEEVQQALGDQIRVLKGQVNAARELVNPTLATLLIVSKGFDGHIDLRFADDRETFGSAFMTVLKAELSHVVNLTDIAITVVRRLP